MAELAPVGFDPSEVAALRLVATMDLGESRQHLDEPVKLSCTDLGAALDASAQTASRRLRDLERAGLITRETASDGQLVTVTDDGITVLRNEYEALRQLFETPSMVEFVGQVTSGMGEGRHYITLDGYMEQFRSRLGYEPFPGTLNIQLTDQSVIRRSRLESTKSIPIDGWKDDQRTYGPATCYPAVVEGPHGGSIEPAHIIEPVRTHHDEDNLEVIAPVRIRDELELRDDDRLLIRSGDLE